MYLNFVNYRQSPYLLISNLQIVFEMKILRINFNYIFKNLIKFPKYHSLSVVIYALSFTKNGKICVEMFLFYSYFSFIISKAKGYKASRHKQKELNN